MSGAFLAAAPAGAEAQNFDCWDCTVSGGCYFCNNGTGPADGCGTPACDTCTLSGFCEDDSDGGGGDDELKEAWLTPDGSQLAGDLSFKVQLHRVYLTEPADGRNQVRSVCTNVILERRYSATVIAELRHESRIIRL